MEIPANTVQAMVPFNGTDEVIFFIEECSTLSIGLMNISSFQQWNKSGLSGAGPFLPESKLSLETSEPYNWTMTNLDPQTQYTAILQSPSSSDATISMSIYLGSIADVDTIIPVRIVCSTLPLVTVYSLQPWSHRCRCLCSICRV